MSIVSHVTHGLCECGIRHDGTAPEPRVMPRDVLREAVKAWKDADDAYTDAWNSDDPFTHGRENQQRIRERFETAKTALRAALAAVLPESDAGLRQTLANVTWAYHSEQGHPDPQNMCSEPRCQQAMHALARP